MQNENRKKNIVQDVVPPDRKTIRNVELPSRRKINQLEEKVEPVLNPNVDFVKKSPSVIKIPTPTNTFTPPPPRVNIPEQKMESEHPPFTYVYDETKKKSKKWFYISVGILIVAVMFGISAFFKSAKIILTPRSQVYKLQSDFSAKKDDTSGSLAFQIVSTTKDVEKTVPATGEKNVQKKATGKIIIFNNSSTNSQKLIATTRFQTTEGLIFRLINPVTVPGQQTKAGKTVAGSIEATVEADAPGDLYNVGLKDFVLPSFKGTAKYTTVYARSKTVMSGGFSGIQKTVDNTVLNSADNELETSLKKTLATDINSQIPANFVLYPDGVSYTLSGTSQAGSNANGAILQKKGVAYAIIFDKGSLTRSIIQKALPGSVNDVIKITNLEKLKFSYPEGKSFDPASGDTSLDFSLSGDVNFVWVFDQNKLKSDLLGLNKKQAGEIIQGYNSITESWLEIYPFWNNIIPTKPDKVTIINTLSE